MFSALLRRLAAHRLPRGTHLLPLILGSLIAGTACRPAGYRPDPIPPEPRLRVATEADAEGAGPASPEETLHRALFGADSAPASLQKPPPNAVISGSGLVSTVLRPGTGARSPDDGDTVVLHYVGWDQNGEKFDSTLARGKPDRMRVQELVSGWREGVQLMVVGEKRRLWIPERIAFGPVPSPGRPAGDLVLDVELLEIQSPGPVPDAPADLTSPPEDASTTRSGLKTKVLKPGKGKTRPLATDRVLVHYSGWTQDGQMFDSSIARGEPTAFGVNEVIPGWTEALMLMVEGESRRLWIPAKLAYGETPRPGAPAGPLVFDVELLEIQH
jgi:peptidylprolyl isomerase